MAETCLMNILIVVPCYAASWRNHDFFMVQPYDNRPRLWQSKILLESNMVLTTTQQTPKMP